MSDKSVKANIPTSEEIDSFIKENGIETPTEYERYRKYHDQLIKANSFGRPTKYFPEFCYALIEYMELGYTYEAIAGLLSVTTHTLYEWEKKFPDFAHAKEIGLAKARFTMESTGLKAMSGDIEGFITTIWIFHMKNRFGWRDNPEDNNQNQMSEFESKIKNAIQLMRSEKEQKLLNRISEVDVTPKEAEPIKDEPKPKKKRKKKRNGEIQKANEHKMLRKAKEAKKNPPDLTKFNKKEGQHE